jgi:hypothetical protein
MKRLSLWLALVLAATLAGLVAAPQGVFVADLLAEAILPDGLAPLWRHLAFELALWGAGLATWIGARRLDWIAGRPLALALVAAPAAGETLIMLGLGRLSGGVATLEGASLRLVVGATTVAWVLWRTRAARPPPRGTA